MRLAVSKSKNAQSLYVIKSTFENNRRSTKIVEKLGTYDELLERLNGQDPFEWAKAYIEELNRKEREGLEPPVTMTYSPTRQIGLSEQRSVHGGYLFLEKLYHEIGLHKICADIQKRYKIEYNLDSILSRLLYTRVLFPGSKRSSYEQSKEFIAPPKFEMHQVYRALDVLCKESEFIQAEVYANSAKREKRNTSVLYCDCTNYFFEIEQASGLRQYGVSKEHRLNPIVQMGLFMDGDGMPLAFDIQSGNTNEQKTLKPLEKRILSEFDGSKFIVCTDAGLGSFGNRSFNTQGERAFIVTQSLKQLSKPVQEWALEPVGWRLQGEKGTFDLTKIDETACRDKLFYKEQNIELGGLTQRMLVTFSLRYRDYERALRERQITRALQVIQKNPSKLDHARSTDYKRLITKTSTTQDGEIAERVTLELDNEAIDREASFDGFYAVCTNLTDDVRDIISVNKRRWEIEECFRIMKREFKARPVYLSLDDRIRAHFLVCFLALLLYRRLEARLDQRFTCEELIGQMSSMTFQRVGGYGFIPSYTRTPLTDALHDAFGFRTDTEIVTDKEMKRIQKICIK